MMTEKVLLSEIELTQRAMRNAIEVKDWQDVIMFAEQLSTLEFVRDYKGE